MSLVLDAFADVSVDALFADQPDALAPIPPAAEAQSVAAPKRVARRRRRTAAEIAIENQARAADAAPVSAAGPSLSDKRRAAVQARWDTPRQFVKKTFDKKSRGSPRAAGTFRGSS